MLRHSRQPLSHSPSWPSSSRLDQYLAQQSPPRAVPESSCRSGTSNNTSAAASKSCKAAPAQWQPASPGILPRWPAGGPPCRGGGPAGYLRQRPAATAAAALAPPPSQRSPAASSPCVCASTLPALSRDRSRWVQRWAQRARKPFTEAAVGCPVGRVLTPPPRALPAAGGPIHWRPRRGGARGHRPRLPW